MYFLLMLSGLKKFVFIPFAFQIPVKYYLQIYES